MANLRPLIPLLLACALSSQADTISQFVLVQTGTLSLTGGVFNDGASFLGTFQIDQSNLPSPNQHVSLPAVDLVTTNGTTGAGITYSTGEIFNNGTFGSPDNESLTEYELDAFGAGGTTDRLLLLNFVSLTGTFTGGQVLSAIELLRTSQIRFDFNGDVIAVDPSFASPEPASWLMFGAGLCGLIVLARGRPGLIAWTR